MEEEEEVKWRDFVPARSDPIRLSAQTGNKSSFETKDAPQQSVTSLSSLQTARSKAPLEDSATPDEDAPGDENATKNQVSSV